MKQFKIIQAYREMEKLADNANLSDNDQWNLYKLRQFLRPHVEFQEEREKTIKEKYKDHTDENGNLKSEFVKDYVTDITSINEMEVELDDFVKPVIPNKGINFMLMETLEDFIEFVQS